MTYMTQSYEQTVEEKDVKIVVKVVSCPFIPTVITIDITFKDGREEIHEKKEMDISYDDAVGVAREQINDWLNWRAGKVS